MFVCSCMYALQVRARACTWEYVVQTTRDNIPPPWTRFVKSSARYFHDGHGSKSERRVLGHLSTRCFQRCQFQGWHWPVLLWATLSFEKRSREVCYLVPFTASCACARSLRPQKRHHPARRNTTRHPIFLRYVLQSGFGRRLRAVPTGSINEYSKEGVPYSTSNTRNTRNKSRFLLVPLSSSGIYDTI